MYHYNARVLSVNTDLTLDLDIDLGFGCKVIKRIHIEGVGPKTFGVKVESIHEYLCKLMDMCDNEVCVVTSRKMDGTYIAGIYLKYDVFGNRSILDNLRANGYITLNKV